MQNKLPTDMLVSPSDSVKEHYTQDYTRDELPDKWSIKDMYLQFLNTSHSIIIIIVTIF